MRRARRQAGFTLIEMMIATLLISLVIGFALQIALSVTLGFKSTREAQGAERSARTAMEYLSDIVRAASTGSSAADLRDARYCTVANGLAVEDHDDGPDKLTVLYASGGVLTSLRSVFTGTSTTFDVMDSTGLAAGDMAIITDGTTGRLVPVVTVSAPTGQATIDTVAPATACSGVPMPSTGYAIGSIVVRGKVATFYVANASDGTPMLWMDPDGDGPATGEPVAEGIEDMQIAVGIDANGDGVITDGGSTTDEWYGNAIGDPTPPDPTVTPWNALRISLVARTLAAEGETLQSSRPALENHAGGTQDIYRRRVLTTVVEIRSLEANP